MSLRIFNTVSRNVEEFHPRTAGKVSMYTCGPTVYRDAHIGNFRSYLMADWIRRFLEHDGYEVNHVKNITDVGHMRQEVLEQGEDKVIAAALAAGKTPEEIASYYTEVFMRDEGRLNILPATVFPRATDHVVEMVELTRRLVEKGYAYEVRGNVYFSVDSFPDYGALSGNTQGGLLEGVRAEVDPLKRDVRDFTLWKAAEPGRTLKWPSPWGDGFPGWHIECSAMSEKYLGPQLDIHTGGVDNIFPHHEGEKAQSEASTGLRFVGYWVHGQHLLADGMKMAKSWGNAYTLDNLAERGFDPLAFRYLCLTARFSTRLNFTFTALRGAQRALVGLRERVWMWSSDNADEAVAAPEDSARWREAFWERAGDNLDLPRALATVWGMVKSDMPSRSKLGLLLEYDELLGLGLASVPDQYRVPADVEADTVRRHGLREQGQFKEADAVREELRGQHYLIRDGREGTRVRPLSASEQHVVPWRSVSSSHEVPSFADREDTVDFSVVVVACNYLEDVQRCLSSALSWSDGHSIEVVVVDNGSTDGTAQWLEDLTGRDGRVRVIHVDHVMGDAAAKNIGLKQSLGRTVIMLDTSAEITGDMYTALARQLEDARVGVVGPFGLRTDDLRHFDEVSVAGEVDAMQAYCFALPRAYIKLAGLLPETFRFYRNLDIQYSFQFKDQGLQVRADPALPVTRHTHRVWSDMAEEEREKLSQSNFRRFLKQWGERKDLLVGSG